MNELRRKKNNHLNVIKRKGQRNKRSRGKAMLKYKSSGNYKNEETRWREKENKIIINERKRYIIKQNIFIKIESKIKK